MHYCKWHLLTRLFDFIADNRIDIIAFGARTSAKRAEMSSATLITSQDLMSNLGSS